MPRMQSWVSLSPKLSVRDSVQRNPGLYVLGYSQPSLRDWNLMRSVLGQTRKLEAANSPRSPVAPAFVLFV